MFWEDEEFEKEFYKRILETEPFSIICGNNFDHITDRDLKKPIVLAVIKQIIQPDCDKKLKENCLQEIGEICCRMYLEYSGVSTDTSVDIFLKDLESSSQWLRKFRRSGSLIYEELHLNGQCCCPIFRNIDLGQSCSELCECCGNARKTYFNILLKRHVEVEFLDTVLCTGSDTCHWMIDISPPAKYF